MRRDRIDALIDEDLSALRRHAPDYDAGRGGERLALATAALSAGTLVGLGSSTAGAKGLLSSLAMKALALALSTGSVALVAFGPPLASPPDDGGSVGETWAVGICNASPAPERTHGAATPRTLPSPSPMPSLSVEPEREKTSSPSVAAVAQRAAKRPIRNEAFQRDLADLERLKALARTDPELVVDAQPTSSRFVEEHEILAIRALVSMNRREEALARIDRFLLTHPNSAFADTVRGLRSTSATR